MGTLLLNKQSEIPLYIQIFQHYYQAIAEGDLLCGDKLPSIRQLAHQLQTARITVVMAYEKLTTGGYIKSRPGIGYEVIFTRQIKPVARPLLPTEGPEPLRVSPAERPADVWREAGTEYYCLLGVPDPHAFPWSSWRRWNNSSSVLKEQLITRYHSPCGLLSLRKELARYLHFSRGINTPAENIIITNGIQEGLSLLGQLFILHRQHACQQKCHIVTESPCYSGAWHLFNYYGAQITAVAVDNQGLRVDGLPEMPVQLCYVTAAHQYPMGSTLSLERREVLLQWAQRAGSYIIEDDYDAVFNYADNPLPALKAMDSQDRVIYMGTFSKSLGPGARLGYLICPDALLSAVQNLKALSNNGSLWLLQQFLAELMQKQLFYAHISKLTCEYEARQRLLAQGLAAIFPDSEIWGTSAGLHLTLLMPHSHSVVAQYRQRCLQAGVRFDTMAELANGSETAWKAAFSRSALFFGFGALNISQLKTVLNVMRKTWAEMRHAAV